MAPIGEPSGTPIAPAAGGYLAARPKVIQQMLGHSSIVTTADMVIKAARSVPGSRLRGTIVPHVPAAVTTWPGGQPVFLL